MPVAKNDQSRSSRLSIAAPVTWKQLERGRPDAFRLSAEDLSDEYCEMLPQMLPEN